MAGPGGAGLTTRSAAGPGEGSGLFSALGLKQSTECPGGRTECHPD